MSEWISVETPPPMSSVDWGDGWKESAILLVYSPGLGVKLGIARKPGKDAAVRYATDSHTHGYEFTHWMTPPDPPVTEGG